MNGMPEWSIYDLSLNEIGPQRSKLNVNKQYFYK